MLPLLQAKFPVLAVDEYQDLGVALHRIVKRVAFDGGVRLFAVGDPDQSIYGFTGADGALLQELAEREDVERVQLQLNYRSASRIVSASEMALGEARGYQSNDPDRQAVIAFVECDDGLEGQAAHAVAEIIPAALAAKPGRALGDIAILYRDYRAGDVVAEAVGRSGPRFVRVDTAAPYRKVALTSWIEDCAAWCAGGWREARPQLRGLLDRWLGFHRARISDAQARRERQRLTGFSGRFASKRGLLGSSWRRARWHARCAHGGRAESRRSERAGGSHVGGARCWRAARGSRSGEPWWPRRVAVAPESVDAALRQGVRI